MFWRFLKTWRLYTARTILPKLRDSLSWLRRLKPQHGCGANVHTDATLRETILNAPTYTAAKTLGLLRMLVYLHAQRLHVVPKEDPD
jgi:hypothetical protein